MLDYLVAVREDPNTYEEVEVSLKRDRLVTIPLGKAEAMVGVDTEEEDTNKIQEGAQI